MVSVSAAYPMRAIAISARKAGVANRSQRSASRPAMSEQTIATRLTSCAWKRMRNELHRSSRRNPAATTPGSERTAPSTRAVRGVRSHAQIGITSVGERNMIAPVTRDAAPTTSMTARTPSGTRASRVSAAPSSLRRCNHQSTATANGVVA